MTIDEAMQYKLLRRSEAFDAADRRRDELIRSLPEFAGIQSELDKMPSKLLAIYRADKSIRDEKFAELREFTDELSRRRAELLAAAGYAEDYDLPKFECDLCRDEGVCGDRICACVKKLIATDGYTSGGLGKALLDKDFDNFSLKYYSDTVLSNGKSERGVMENNLLRCRKFANTFCADGRNLLLMGGTGLGKTHLSAAIAKVVISAGYITYYDTAASMFACYDAVRFGKREQSALSVYEKSTLLLIDDLGAENVTSQTVSLFFELVNNRILNGLSTVISTNLKPSELKKTYHDRTYSRILGEYEVLVFAGKDVRFQKLTER